MELSPAQIAKCDQELALIDANLDNIIKQWPDFFADESRIVRIGLCAYDLADFDSSLVRSMLAVAVERLAKRQWK